MAKKKKTKELLSEEYVVKFWIWNDATAFWEQRSESVRAANKDDHQKAEDFVVAKYKQQGRSINIVSVTYQ